MHFDRIPMTWINLQAIILFDVTFVVCVLITSCACRTTTEKLLPLYGVNDTCNVWLLLIFLARSLIRSTIFPTILQLKCSRYIFRTTKTSFWSRNLMSVWIEFTSNRQRNKKKRIPTKYSTPFRFVWCFFCACLLFRCDSCDDTEASICMETKS